ncbi:MULTISPECIES: hypothetical protein [Roseomonadaceae]|uniref:Uncharacterized protein n=1 Tax=Falsiroseomonas oleicola TaxID=2801474 RepID=A0ABS6H9D7_9PROT|nr:hypothetical protein [Roseomonas oleicola]MBU8545332.1 hypothetical protein [Roseomonas oleicola]
MRRALLLALLFCAAPGALPGQTLQRQTVGAGEAVAVAPRSLAPGAEPAPLPALAPAPVAASAAGLAAILPALLPLVAAALLGGATPGAGPVGAAPATTR